MAKAKKKPAAKKKTERPQLRAVEESSGVTHLKLIQLNRALQHYGSATAVKFGYMVARNRLKIKPVLEALESVRRPSEEFQEFAKERIELGKTLAKKDEKTGKPKVKMVATPTPFGPRQEEVFDFEDEAEAEAKIEKFKKSKKWKHVVEEQEAKDKEYNDLLQEEVPDIDFYTLPFNKLPQSDVVRAADLELFLELGIVEEPEDD